jgi:hypothetical protein
MIPILNEGAKGLERFQEEAKRAGLVMSTETAKAADELSDSIAVLNGYGRGFWQEVATPMVKALAEIATSMRMARADGEGFFGAMVTGFQTLTRIGLWGSEQSQQNDVAGKMRSNAMAQSTAFGTLSAMDGRDDAFATMTRQQVNQKIAVLQTEYGRLQGEYNRLNAFNNPTGDPAAKADSPDLPDKAGKVSADPNNVAKNYSAMWADVLKQRQEFNTGMAKLGEEQQRDEDKAADEDFKLNKLARWSAIFEAKGTGQRRGQTVAPSGKRRTGAHRIRRRQRKK